MDTGLHKVARYDAARGLDTLDTERMSQDSRRAARRPRRPHRARARAPVVGRARPRCGRMREPEIARVDLAGPLLEVSRPGAPTPRRSRGSRRRRRTRSPRRARCSSASAPSTAAALTPLGRRHAGAAAAPAAGADPDRGGRRPRRGAGLRGALGAPARAGPARGDDVRSPRIARRVGVAAAARAPGRATDRGPGGRDRARGYAAPGAFTEADLRRALFVGYADRAGPAPRAAGHDARARDRHRCGARPRERRARGRVPGRARRRRRRRGRGDPNALVRVASRVERGVARADRGRRRARPGPEDGACPRLAARAHTSGCCWPSARRPRTPRPRPSLAGGGVARSRPDEVDDAAAAPGPLRRPAIADLAQALRRPRGRRRSPGSTRPRTLPYALAARARSPRARRTWTVPSGRADGARVLRGRRHRLGVGRSCRSCSVWPRRRASGRGASRWSSRCWRRTAGPCRPRAICAASGSAPIPRCARSCAAGTRDTRGPRIPGRRRPRRGSSRGRVRSVPIPELCKRRPVQ